MAALFKYFMSVAVIVPAVIVIAIFLGFAAVVETPATTTPAWKIERLKPEPNTPYIAQGSLSPIYPATPGKELLGKPMAMAMRAPNTLHEAVTAKQIDMRQALQIHNCPCVFMQRAKKTEIIRNKAMVTRTSLHRSPAG